MEFRRVLFRSLHRATVIDVDQIGVCAIGNLTGFAHGVDAPTEKLYADGPLVFEDVEFFYAFGGITYQAFGRDEFSVHEIGTVLLAHITERRIAHVLHGGEEEGKFTELYVADADHAGKQV